jgi:alginate O-acetyltransferase complex protein AlgI
MSLSFWIRDYVFLPLATLRREVWWRNLALVISMFIFGLWHKGSFLFMIWGTYHGLLLVFHRQWQELRKRIGFEWSGALATGISWLLTFSAVSVGYIFFRSHTMGQVRSMLRAIVSPHTYRHPALAHSFYFMTLAAMIGYFAALGGSALLDRVSVWATSEGAAPSRTRLLLAAFANERWVWITPIVVVAAIYCSVLFQPGEAATGPVMYALF